MPPHHVVRPMLPYDRRLGWLPLSSPLLGALPTHGKTLSTHVRIIPCAFTGWAQRMRLGGLEHLIPWDGSWTRGDARQGVSSSQTSSTSRLRHPFSKPPVHGACGSVCVHHGKQSRLTSSTPPIYIIPSAHPVYQSFLLSLLILQTKHSPYSPLPIFQFCELFFFFLTFSTLFLVRQSNYKPLAGPFQSFFPLKSNF